MVVGVNNKVNDRVKSRVESGVIVWVNTGAKLCYAQGYREQKHAVER